MNPLCLLNNHSELTALISFPTIEGSNNGSFNEELNLSKAGANFELLIENK